MGNCPPMLSPLAGDTNDSFSMTPNSDGTSSTPRCCRSLDFLPRLGQWDLTVFKVTIRENGLDLDKRVVNVEERTPNLVDAPWDGRSTVLTSTKSDFTKEHLSRISHQFCVAHPEFVAADRQLRKSQLSKGESIVSLNGNKKEGNLNKSEMDALNRLGKRKKKEEEDMDKLLKAMISKKAKVNCDKVKDKSGSTSLNLVKTEKTSISKPSIVKTEKTPIPTPSTVKPEKASIPTPSIVKTEKSAIPPASKVPAVQIALPVATPSERQLKSVVRSDRQRLRERAQREREKLKPTPLKPIDRVVTCEQVEMAMRSIEQEMGSFCPDQGTIVKMRMGGNNREEYKGILVAPREKTNPAGIDNPGAREGGKQKKVN